jgi:hypothetical protein
MSPVPFLVTGSHYEYPDLCLQIDEDRQDALNLGQEPRSAARFP